MGKMELQQKNENDMSAEDYFYYCLAAYFFLGFNY